VSVIKRCSVCCRFRSYDEDDRFCVACGHDGLDLQCTCGRAYDYLRPDDEAVLHCPRCGKVLRGRQPEYNG
jgi:hypothetical protein